MMIRSQVQIRLAKTSDAYRIAIMSRELIEHGLPVWSWKPGRVMRGIRDPNTLVIVAEVQGAVVGFAIMEFGREEAHLDLLGVAAQFQRRGIGRQLVQWLEACALVAGTPIIHLEVRANNAAAQRFYRKLGYVSVGRLQRYYCGEEPAVRMSRDLWADASTRAS